MIKEPLCFEEIGAKRMEVSILIKYCNCDVNGTNVEMGIGD
jgi:hypothetical protein